MPVHFRWILIDQIRYSETIHLAWGTNRLINPFTVLSFNGYVWVRCDYLNNHKHILIKKQKNTTLNTPLINERLNVVRPYSVIITSKQVPAAIVDNTPTNLTLTGAMLICVQIKICTNFTTARLHTKLWQMKTIIFSLLFTYICLV